MDVDENGQRNRKVYIGEHKLERIKAEEEKYNINGMEERGVVGC